MIALDSDIRLPEAQHVKDNSRLQAVIGNPYLSVKEKKAVLAFWASDACAVESQPALRMPPGFSKPLAYDDIMSALTRFD